MKEEEFRNLPSYEHTMMCSYPEGCTCGTSGINRAIRRAFLMGAARGVVVAKQQVKGRWKRGNDGQVHVTLEWIGVEQWLNET